MTSIETTGKTIDEALQAALNELKVGLERVEYQVLEAPSKGLFGFIGSKPARLKVTVLPVDPINVAKEFLQKVAEKMGVSVYVEKLSGEDAVTLNLRGDDVGVLIGKHGQTLDALQYLTNLVCNRDAERKVKIILDVEDYRRRRTETLTKLALRLADKVKRKGEKVVLEPMSPHERKVIHVALQNDNRIVTYSEGDEPFRKVVIALRR